MAKVKVNEMDRKELNKKMDSLKENLNEAIYEEVLKDRVKTAATERKEARSEINSTLTSLEKTHAGPSQVKRNGYLISTIEAVRNANDGRDWQNSPPLTEEIVKISETRNITIAEAEIIFFAIRCEAMLKTIESLKPEVTMALMAGVL